MVSGMMAPELGGRPEYLDIVGVNFYPSNQWYHGGDHPLRPPRVPAILRNAGGNP
jgi:hypothetical protein